MNARYLIALAVTLGCELPLVGWLGGAEVRRRILRDCLLANLFTHPLAVVLHRALAPPDAPYGAVFWLIELGVVLAEAGVYRWVTGLTGRRALGISLLANGVTAGLSPVFFA